VFPGDSVVSSLHADRVLGLVTAFADESLTIAFEVMDSPRKSIQGQRVRQKEAHADSAHGERRYCSKCCRRKYPIGHTISDKRRPVGRFGVSHRVVVDLVEADAIGGLKTQSLIAIYAIAPSTHRRCEAGAVGLVIGSASPSERKSRRNGAGFSSKLHRRGSLRQFGGRPQRAHTVVLDRPMTSWREVK